MKIEDLVTMLSGSVDGQFMKRETELGGTCGLRDFSAERCFPPEVNSVWKYRRKAESWAVVTEVANLGQGCTVVAIVDGKAVIGDFLNYQEWIRLFSPISDAT